MSVNPVDKKQTDKSTDSDFDGVVDKAREKAKDKPQDRTATDNEVWPPVTHTVVEPLRDNKVRYTHDGNSVVVERSVNPELYKFLVKLYDLNQSPSQRAQVDKALKDDVPLADRNTESPKPEDVKGFEWSGNLEDAEFLTYEDHDGKQVAVSKALTPELFASLQQRALSAYTLNNNTEDGRIIAGADTYIPEHEITKFGWLEEFGNGVMQFETRDGKKYAVSQFDNKELYDRVVSLRKDYDKSQGSGDDLREKYKIPDPAQLDILSQRTGEKASDDDKESMTVVELATKNLLDKYKKLIDDGKVDKNSDIFKLVRTIEAKASMDGGRTITPYIEDPRGGGTTWRQSADKGELLTQEDMQDILNGDSVDETLNRLFTEGEGENGKIGKEFQAEIDTALGKVSQEDKTKIADQLYDTLTGLDYVKYLAEMKQSGLGTQAAAETAGLISSLELLDPERARKAESELQQNGILVEMDTLIGDPSAIPDEYKDMAYKDFGALIKGTLKADDLPRRVQETIEKFWNELIKDKTKMADFVELSQQLQRGEITQADFDAKVEKTYIPMDVDANDFKKAIGTLNKYGVFGSLSAFGSLGGAIYMLAAKNGQLSDEPLERLAIAKDFITFLGGGAQLEKTGLFDLFTKTNTADLLGLGKTVPEIWGKESKLGKKIEGYLRDHNIAGVPEAAQSRASSAIELASFNAGNSPGSVVDQVNLAAGASGVQSFDDPQSQAFLTKLIERAGGTPPSDFSRFAGLQELAAEQNLTITDDMIRDVLNEQRAANQLPALDAESVSDFSEQLESASHRPVPVGSAASSLMTFDSSLASLYQNAVEFFEARGTQPPSLESFEQVVQERQERAGRSSPAGTDIIDPRDAELSSDDMRRAFELDRANPPATDVLDAASAHLVDTARSASIPTGAGIVSGSTVTDALGAGAAVKPGLAAKVGGSVIKVLGVAPDILSVADIVMGAFTIKDAIKNDSDLGKANGALQIISGAAGTAAGVIGTVGLFASIGALAGATGPLFLVTATLGLVTAIIGIFVDHEKKQKATDKEGQWFKDAAELGLAQDDWGDKLEYARYSFYEHGKREAPPGQSIYDYQKDEWEHFKETPSKDGSSINRLDDDLHLQKYDKAFYEENRQVIHDIRGMWDNWRGKDAIVSIDDLKKYAEDSGRSEHDRNAAKFLLNNRDFWKQLDTQYGKGSEDGKVSTNDLNTWLTLVGYTEEGYGTQFVSDNKDVINLIREKWDNWNGKDDIVSRADLEKYADDSGRSSEERDAARFLLNNQGFFDQLDNMAKNDKRDGKISDKDLHKWLQSVGEESLDKSDLKYNPNDSKPAWSTMRF